MLLDTMIVRSVLVTTINLDLGGKLWWPNKVDLGSSEADPDAPERELVGA